MKYAVACLLGLLLMNSLHAQSDATFGAPYTIAEGSQLHTNQVFGAEPGPVLDQFDTAIKRLSGRMVKLHIVAVDNATIDAVVAAVKQRYVNALPAISCAVGKLSSSDAKLGLDAVIVFRGPTQPSKRVVEDDFGRILHPGPRFYVSGQAEKGLVDDGETLATLTNLAGSIAPHQATLDDIVQLKAFITPIRSEKRVRAEIQKFLGDRRVPVVVVEWQSNLPIEIEMIAAAPAASPAGGVEYVPIPGMASSPIYARITKLHGNQTIYVGGLYARGSERITADAEVKDVFASLQDILKANGNDLEHLVKATYYCSSNETSNQLNVLRPSYYNPSRPPAASKAIVNGVGRPNRYLTIDMIAAPR